MVTFYVENMALGQNVRKGYRNPDPNCQLYVEPVMTPQSFGRAALGGITQTLGTAVYPRV